MKKSIETFTIDLAMLHCPAEWEDAQVRNWIRANLSKEIPVELIAKRRRQKCKEPEEEGGSKP
jgi:hypothetical protein